MQNKWNMLDDVKYYKIRRKQECIPVGCVLSAAVAISGRGCFPMGECLSGVVSARGVSAQGGVCPEGVFPGGECLPRGEADPPVERILDICCENITLPQWTVILYPNPLYLEKGNVKICNSHIQKRSQMRPNDKK